MRPVFAAAGLLGVLTSASNALDYPSISYGGITLPGEKVFTAKSPAPPTNRYNELLHLCGEVIVRMPDDKEAPNSMTYEWKCDDPELNIWKTSSVCHQTWPAKSSWDAEKKYYRNLPGDASTNAIEWDIGNFNLTALWSRDCAAK